MSVSPWDFRRAPVLDPDPIFAISAQAKAAGPQAIDGTIGVVMDEQGKVTVFPSVKKALADIGSQLSETGFSYPPLLGLPDFRSSVHALIFGDASVHAAGIAATAGTGAIAINLRLAKMLHQNATVILPAPAWANHLPVCQATGLDVMPVAYLDRDGKASIEGIAAALKTEKRPAVVLLQVGCHNPTGLDVTKEQWLQLADLLQQSGSLAFLDFAYQGFKAEPELDSWPIELMISRNIPTLIAWSASKNHSIYGARCGYACAVVPDDATQQRLEVNYSRITRGMHSAAPTFGQMVVARVQQHYHLEWLQDLQLARQVMQSKRDAMRQLLPERFKVALDGHGMFAMLPLTVQQIRALKTAHGVFLTEDGRINIAGIPFDRIQEMCEAILLCVG